MNGSDFLDLNSTQGILYDVDKYRCVIGHNRWGTMGGKEAMDGHPFTHGSITLVHNGTMEFWTGLDKSFDIDSEAICSALSMDTPKTVLEKLDGAYSLVWHDALDNTIHFARNSERPMCMAWSKDKKTMLYASEAWMISQLAPAILQIGTVYDLAVGNHITFSMEDAHLEAYSEEEFTPFPSAVIGYGNGWYDKYYPPYVKKDKGKGIGFVDPDKGKPNSSALLQQYGFVTGDLVPFYSDHFQEYSGGQGRGTVDGRCAYTTLASKFKVKAYGQEKWVFLTQDKLEGSVMSAYMEGKQLVLVLRDIVKYVKTIDPDPFIVNAKGETITVNEFDVLSMKGCAMCGDNVLAEDSEYIDWTDDDRPFCLDCTNDAEVATAV